MAATTPHPAFGHLLPQGEKVLWHDLAKNLEAVR